MMRGDITTNTACLAAALAYARSGLAVFPAPRGYKMSYKAARFCGGRRWGATKDEDEIRRDWAKWPEANVCIVTGAESGIFVVETDTPEGHRVDGQKTLASLIERFGSWPETRQAISPSGSRHYYWRMPDNGSIVRNSTSTLGPGIDVRGNGGMVLAPPSVRDGSSYRWLNQALIRNAPEWLLALVAYHPAPPSPYLTTDNTEIIYGALVEETMKHVPTELKWRERNRIGMAIFTATDGSAEGLKIWDAWLARSGKYSREATRQRWAALHKYPPNGSVGYGTLSYLATRAKPDWLNELDKKLIRMTNRR